MVISEESFGVKHAGRFFSELKDEYENNKEVTIDFSNVKRIDLSIVQIIIAAGRSAKRDGKRIRIKSLSEYVKKQMKICGL